MQRLRIIPMTAALLVMISASACGSAPTATVPTTVAPTAAPIAVPTAPPTAAVGERKDVSVQGTAPEAGNQQAGSPNFTIRVETTP